MPDVIGQARLMAGKEAERARVRQEEEEAGRWTVDQPRPAREVCVDVYSSFGLKGSTLPALGLDQNGQHPASSQPIFASLPLLIKQVISLTPTALFLALVTRILASSFPLWSASRPSTLPGKRVPVYMIDRIEKDPNLSPNFDQSRPKGCSRLYHNSSPSIASLNITPRASLSNPSSNTSIKLDHQ